MIVEVSKEKKLLSVIPTNLKCACGYAAEKLNTVLLDPDEQFDTRKYYWWLN